MSSTNRKLSDEHEAELVAAYVGGETAPKLAARFNCSSGTVYNLLARRGISRRIGGPRRYQHSAEQQRAMIAAYLDDEPMSSILARFDCTQSTFYKIRNRHGVPARERVGVRLIFNGAQEARIVQQYLDGRSLSDLGREHGCCLETVRTILRRHDVARRPRGNTAREFSTDEIVAFAARWAAGESQHSIGLSVGLSQNQISRLLRAIDQPPEVRIPRGEAHSQWAGGRVKLGGGYVGIRLQPDDPFAEMAHSSGRGYVLEHRLVMARTLGRALSPSETVHHINGNRTDNRPENLQLRRGRHGAGQAMKCADCGSHNIVETPLAELNPT